MQSFRSSTFNAVLYTVTKGNQLTSLGMGAHVAECMTGRASPVRPTICLLAYTVSPSFSALYIGKGREERNGKCGEKNSVETDHWIMGEEDADTSLAKGEALGMFHQPSEGFRPA